MDKILYYSALGLSSKDIIYLTSSDKFKKGGGVLSLLDDFDLYEKNIKNKIVKSSKKVDFEFYQEYLDNNNIDYITYLDDDYPMSLRLIEDAPAILYIRGKLNINKPAIAVVGARKCTDYGKWATNKFVGELEEYGVNIISGMALGVDKYAHTRALELGMTTTAVLGCGVDLAYPSSNQNLYKKIIETGAVISEYPLGTPALPYNFPYRNRIISALSAAIIVVEAKEKSGTLITANYAAQQGKEVFVVPGNLNSLYSVGTNRLIRDGAKILTCTEDITNELEVLKLIKSESEKIRKDIDRLDEEEKLIYSLINDQPMDGDEIARRLGLSINKVLAKITLMEMKGIVTNIQDKWSIN